MKSIPLFSSFCLTAVIVQLVPAPIPWLSDLNISAFMSNMPNVICNLTKELPELSSFYVSLSWTTPFLFHYSQCVPCSPPALRWNTWLTPEDTRHTCGVSMGLTPQVCLLFSHWVTARDRSMLMWHYPACTFSLNTPTQTLIHIQIRFFKRYFVFYFQIRVTLKMSKLSSSTRKNF